MQIKIADNIEIVARSLQPSVQEPVRTAEVAVISLAAVKDIRPSRWPRHPQAELIRALSGRMAAIETVGGRIARTVRGAAGAPDLLQLRLGFGEGRRAVSPPRVRGAEDQNRRLLPARRLSHNEGDMTKVRLAFEFVANAPDVDTGLGRRRHSILVSDFPSAVVKIVRREAQPVPASRIVRRVIIAVARHFRLETGSANHPGGVIDNATVTAIARNVGDAISPFFSEWPAREHVFSLRGNKPLLGESFSDFASAQSAAVNHWHRQIAVQKSVPAGRAECNR